MYKHENELPLILTAKDLKVILNIGINSAYELLNSGEFKTVKIGRQHRVYRTVFLKWLSGEEEKIA